MSQTFSLSESTTDHLERLRKNLNQVIHGKSDVIDKILVAILVGDSVLLEDVPGVGKTTLAKAIAASLELEFRRVQCTPDLLPGDIFGTSIYNPIQGTFEFKQGPIFSNILLVDEINRASPRTQSALLEAMAENQVTIEGETYALERPFVVIATQNPGGFHGTFPLPESQVDRFLMQISMDYPDREAELEIVYQQAGLNPLQSLAPVLSKSNVLELQQSVTRVHFDRKLAEYLLEIVERTRNHSKIALGCSPRGAIRFFQAARAWAFLSGRDFVLPDDIQNMAPLVLCHRLSMHTVASAGETTSLPEMVVGEILNQVEVPV